VPIHPFIVHFVVASVTISMLFDLVGVVTRKREYERFGFILLILSGVSVILAIVSGLVEENSIEIPAEAISTFEAHETIAFITAILILIQMLWRIGIKNKLQGNMRILFMIMVVAGLISVYIGAYLGGQLVYRYGTGIRTVEPLSGEQAPESPINKKLSEDYLFFPEEDSLNGK